MGEKLHVAVACGGTGGHMFPGLATARELRRRGHHVTLWLSGKNVEQTVLSDWKGPIITIASEGFQFGAFRSVLTFFRIAFAALRCWIAMLRHRPDVVLAMGSYSSVGPCLAARMRGVPIVLHEANAVPGRAVRLLAKSASAIGICFEETRFYLKGQKVVSTGMPLRSDIQRSDHPFKTEGFHLLVMGGSGGAHAINEMVSQAVCRMPDLLAQVTHLTGADDEATVRSRYRAAGVQADVHAFTQNMAELYESADFVVCRAGASSCAELGVFGLPALLVPYPHAASDHQTVNAKALEKIGAADVVQEADVSVEWMVDYLSAQVRKPERLEKMRCRALRPDSLGAAKKLAEVVEQCAAK
jgi:UDP-N-acetylglucosamine--N-acetylmuramyl-(pentapeptide) pyrophosphoryl-undecaprenol N-acetylglucosamine transferase